MKELWERRFFLFKTPTKALHICTLTVEFFNKGVEEKGANNKAKRIREDAFMLLLLSLRSHTMYQNQSFSLDHRC